MELRASINSMSCEAKRSCSALEFGGVTVESWVTDTFNVSGSAGAAASLASDSGICIGGRRVKAERVQTEIWVWGFSNFGFFLPSFCYATFK
jgi:hypothetical protein